MPAAFPPETSHAEREAETPTRLQTVTEKRQDTMRELDRHMKLLAEIMYGGNDQTQMQAELEQHTQVIQEIAKDIPSLFPDWDDSNASRAKPVIWERPNDFEKAAKEFDIKVKEFTRAVEQGDKNAARLSYKRLELKKACASCHDTFRKPENGATGAPPSGGAPGPSAGEPPKQ
jgi:cytochrome c556